MKGDREEPMADEIVKCPYSSLSVIPVKTGIQYFYALSYSWIMDINLRLMNIKLRFPAYAGMTTFCEVVNG